MKLYEREREKKRYIERNTTNREQEKKGLGSDSDLIAALDFF